MNQQHASGPNDSLLFAAASKGDCEGIKTALATGVSIGARDENGRTALHHAAGEWHAAAVGALLAAGAEVDADDRWQCTPLWYATLGPKFSMGPPRSPPIIRALCTAGADRFHECQDPRFDGRTWTPWGWGANGGGVKYIAAAFSESNDPELCADDDPFDVRSAGLRERLLWLESHRLEACLEFARRRGIEHLFSRVDWQPEQVERLRSLAEFSALKSVMVRLEKGWDATWVEGLRQLEKLAIMERPGRLDLSRLTRLQDLRVSWSPGLRLPDEHVPIESLDLPYPNPKPSDLRWLKPWSTVTTFSAWVGSLSSLRGIEVMQNVEVVSLAMLRRLTDIDALMELPRLRVLRIDDGAKAIQIDLIRRLETLETLVIVGRITLPTLKFLDDLPNLREFRFIHVNIGDGDLTPLLRLDDVAFLPGKRHYSHRNSEISELIAQRKASSDKG